MTSVELPPDEAGRVRSRWQWLGLPGLVDVHTHFMPRRVLEKVWSFFDRVGELGAREPWPIAYRLPDADRVGRLRDFGLRGFTALNYAHKPDMAAWLNAWTRDFCAATPGCVTSATFFPEPSAPAYVSEALAAGTRVVKVHVQVGDFAPDDPLLDPAWSALADAGTPVVIHAGSGPVAAPHTGPEPMARVLQRHPRLCVVLAHMGAPEYSDFLALAERYERTYLDTTMVFTDFFSGLGAPFPDSLLPRLADLGPKVLLGSDFPTIPYPYAHQLEVLARLRDREPRLGDDWLREVCWTTPKRVLGLG